MAVATYAFVHHIESNVRARLRNGLTAADILRALFPGGTITGCPKVRCMQIICELEDRPRLIYAGSLGYLNRDGSLDLNILIRTFMQSDNQLYFRAGAGIVADSDPEREFPGVGHLLQAHHGVYCPPGLFRQVPGGQTPLEAPISGLRAENHVPWDPWARWAIWSAAPRVSSASFRTSSTTYRRPWSPPGGLYGGVQRQQGWSDPTAPLFRDTKPRISDAHSCQVPPTSGRPPSAWDAMPSSPWDSRWTIWAPSRPADRASWDCRTIRAQLWDSRCTPWDSSSTDAAMHREIHQLLQPLRQRIDPLGRPGSPLAKPRSDRR